MNLDEKYKSVLDTINKYPDQILQVWEDFKNIDVPVEYSEFSNVILIGMGGSALGGRAIDYLLDDDLPIPFETFNQYNLPGYVGEKTLLILSSYSGSTEEVLTAAKDAIKKKLKIFIIAQGGELLDMAIDDNLPYYKIDPKFNPSGQPRNAVGYTIGAVISVLDKTGIIKFDDDKMQSVRKTMTTVFDKNSIETSDAYKLAKTLINKSPVFVSSEHLYEVVHISKNQFNESSKTFSVHFELPELNHHLMEGLKNPKGLEKLLQFVFIESNLYHERVQKRYPLTQEVVKKNGYEYYVYKPETSTRLDQMLETLVFFSLVVYHLTKLYGIDPNEIPWVDYFKQMMKV